MLRKTVIILLLMIFNWIEFVFIFTCVRNVIKDFELKQDSVETEEIEIKEPCLISAFSPVDDFNKLLESGIDSKRGTYVQCTYLIIYLFTKNFTIILTYVYNI